MVLDNSHAFDRIPTVAARCDCEACTDGVAVGAAVPSDGGGVQGMNVPDIATGGKDGDCSTSRICLRCCCYHCHGSSGPFWMSWTHFQNLQH